MLISGTETSSVILSQKSSLLKECSYNILLLYRYIYNGIIFPSLNHAKSFDSIPDEHSHKVVRQLAKSHAQWYASNKVKLVRK